MDAVMSFFNFIKNVATGGRNAARIAEDGSYAVKLIKEKFIRALRKLLKAFMYQFFLYGLIIVVVISAVAIVFEIFSDFKFGNTTQVGDLDPRIMQEWSESLTEEDIKTMQTYGASIHPKKIPKYVEIEDTSYKKNVNIKIPELTARWSTYSGRRENTKFLDYDYTRGDTAYPYRQWWQSTAGIDAINDTANIESKMKIVEDAKEALKPIFAWADPFTMEYENGSVYDKTSSKEEITVNTEVETVVIELVGGDSSDRETERFYTEVTTWKPLPFIDQVSTMFANHMFSYKPTSSTVNSSAGPYVEYFWRTDRERIDGEWVEVKNRYRVTTSFSYTTNVTSWELTNESKEYITRFMDFIDMNKIDTKDDPLVMLYMSETLPQSFDFVSQYRDYLQHMDYIGYQSGVIGGGGTYDGDFGDFTGGTFAWPVPSNTRITSYYGYRIHPIFKTKKMHTGIDIAAGMGVDILAVADGTVSLVGPSGGYGLTVKINHGGGIETLYAHNSKLLVTPGQVVRKGDVIAKAGSTGNSTGPHLHFEVRKNGKHIDPLPWLRAL